MTLSQLFKNLLGVSLGDLFQVKEAVNVMGNCTGNKVVDLSLGNVVTATMTGTGIWTFSNVAVSGKCSTVTFVLTNAGAFAITWSPVPKWPAATPPTMTVAGVDILVFTTTDGGTTWYAVASSLAAA
jgi:hypothetical protein